MTDAEYRDLAKKDLDRYDDAALAQSELMQRMDKIRAQIESMVSIPKLVQVQSGHDDNYTRLHDELCDMGLEYADRQHESKRVCLQIERRISKLEGIQGAILFRRYCELKEWSVICCELREIVVNDQMPYSYSDQSVYNKHNEGLLEYGRMIGNADK